MLLYDEPTGEFMNGVPGLFSGLPQLKLDAPSLMLRQLDGTTASLLDTLSRVGPSLTMTLFPLRSVITGQHMETIFGKFS